MSSDTVIKKRAYKKYSRNKKMRNARLAHDYTQKDLAEKVGVSRQTIGLIETGKYNPSLSLCIDICKALNQTLNDLFWKE